MPRKILIVEDEALIGLDLEDALRGAGFSTVGPARTVAEARAFLDAATCDAALLDVILSDGASVPVADMLRAREIPFAFISGSRPDVLPPHLSNEPFISKPSHPDVVLAVVRRLLGDDPPESPPDAV